MTPFDFIKAISETKDKEIIKEPQADKDYKAFIINRGLAYFHDTVLHANEMNRHPWIPRDWQFSYLLNSITKKRRYSKWADKTTKSEDLELVMQYYDYSKQKAMTALSILTDEQLAMIKKKLERGGKT
jgi:NACalpha-BTF3-like transcription factor